MTGTRRTRVLLAAVLWSLGLAQPAPALPLSAAESANASGAESFHAGRFEEAASRFEHALLLDPGCAPAAANLGAALATLAQRDLAAGRHEEGRTRLVRAVALAPAEAPYRLLLAALDFRRGDLYEARLGVDRALALDPDLAGARELSGDLHYQDGALERARGDWEAALPGAGAHAAALRARLERLDRESRIEADSGRDISRHFSVQFEGPVPAAVARTALRLLEEAHDLLSREFGRPPQHDIPVLLYSREGFSEVTRSPAWVAGSYDGKIRVPVGGLDSAADAERLGPVLAHELTHAFLRANLPGRVPLWFEEGLAEHFRGVTREDALRRLGGSGAAFGSLDEVSAALRGGARVGAAYAAAALAVQELVRMDGFWLPRRTLERMAEGSAFGTAFRDAAGMSLPEFEERWTRLQR